MIVSPVTEVQEVQDNIINIAVVKYSSSYVYQIM